MALVIPVISTKEVEVAEVVSVLTVVTTCPIFPPPAAAQVLSPAKKTELSAVPVPSLAVGTVPLPILEAFKEVKLAPLIAG